MKITDDTLKVVLAQTLAEIVQSMPGGAYKWLAGGLAGMKLTDSDALRTTLGIFRDGDLYDTDKMRDFFKAAFDQNGGRLQIRLFDRKDSLLSMFAPPLQLTFTHADAEKIIEKLEQTPAVVEPCSM